MKRIYSAALYWDISSSVWIGFGFEMLSLDGLHLGEGNRFRQVIVREYQISFWQY
jgi:hypothetical protein